MKRLIGFLLILVLLISLASCGNIDLSKDGKKEIINNAWKRLGADTIMKFNEDGTGEYDSFKITKWSYEGVFLDFSYEDTFLEYNVDKEFKLLYDSNNILTLTCEDDENIVFVKESQYDEASKTFEIKKEEVESSNDDESEDDTATSISENEAKEKALSSFQYQTYKLEDGIYENRYSKSYTVSNVKVGSIETNVKDWQKKYEVIINGTCYVYNKYGSLDRISEYAIYYDVGYDSSVEYVKCYVD